MFPCCFCHYLTSFPLILTHFRFLLPPYTLYVTLLLLEWTLLKGRIRFPKRVNLIHLSLVSTTRPGSNISTEIHFHLRVQHLFKKLTIKNGNSGFGRFYKFVCRKRFNLLSLFNKFLRILLWYFLKFSLYSYCKDLFFNNQVCVWKKLKQAGLLHSIALEIYFDNKIKFVLNLNRVAVR